MHAFLIAGLPGYERKMLAVPVLPRDPNESYWRFVERCVSEGRILQARETPKSRSATA